MTKGSYADITFYDEDTSLTPGDEGDISYYAADLTGANFEKASLATTGDQAYIWL